jgi:HK97 family phage major capsid protein/HK97 family phage prohead protease
MLDRAWATLDIKSLDADLREIVGIATTPSPDVHGEIIEPQGAEFTLPLPLLWQHSQATPVGEVIAAEVTPDGIAIKARIARVDEPGVLQDRLTEVWHTLKAGLVRGLSIGFRRLEQVPINPRRPFGPQHVKRWCWRELSAVTIPANLEATIINIKSAACGPKDRPAMLTTSERIADHETTRAALLSNMTDLMERAEAKGETLDGEQSTKYEGYAQRVKGIDAQITRLRELETLNLAQATPVPALPAPVPRVSLKSNAPKGSAFVRMACAQLLCNGNRFEAAEYAKRWDDSTPEVALALKAAIAPGTTQHATWAGPLVNQTIANDFLELLRPATIIGNISGFRDVPFNTKVPSQTAGGTYGWVGEAKPKPLTSLAFSAVSLPWAKVAGIIVLTDELVKLSSPSAEELAKKDMIAGIAQFLDAQFIDPAVALVANVNPASITNGAPTAAATTNPLADIMSLINHFATNNIPVGGVHIILSPANALALSFRSNLDGSPQYPGLTMNGGTYRGLTFVTSNAAGTNVIALQPGLVLLADDGGVTIDASREASLQMDSAPASPADATTVYVSMFQTNSVALRAERYITWLRANANAVKYLTAANYPAPTGVAGEAPAPPV